jgi:hypothetical protein
MKLSNLPLLLILLYASSGFSQEVMRLKEGEPAGKGSLSELAWLAGYWKGSGLGGDCEELWLPPIDSTMYGIFRFAEAGTVQFTEYMVIEQQDSTLTVKIKHFSRDLTAWEEKENWTTFKFIKAEGQTAYFNGLTYHREQDKLTIRLQLKTKDGYKTEDFILGKTGL